MLRSILIVDDHVAVREGMVRLLSAEFPGAEIATAGETENVQSDVLFKVSRRQFDVIVLDLNMPHGGGFNLLSQLKDAAPLAAILIYTIHPEDQFGIRALRAGADGYLTKDRSAGELLDAVRTLSEGKRFITPRLAENLANMISSPGKVSPHELLSDRELQVLLKLSSGLTPTEIAEELSLSIKTISTYRSRLLEKLGLHSTADLIRYALERGLE